MAARFRVGAKSEILQDAVGALAAARDHSVTLLPSEHDSWEKRWLASSMCQALTNAQSTVFNFDHRHLLASAAPRVWQQTAMSTMRPQFGSHEVLDRLLMRAQEALGPIARATLAKLVRIFLRAARATEFVFVVSALMILSNGLCTDIALPQEQRCPNMLSPPTASHMVSVDRCPVALSRDLLLRLAPEDMKQCILSLGLVDGIVHAGGMEGANT